MNQTRYNLSFTAGGLLYHESLIIAETYIQTRDWDQVAIQVTENNLLQSRMASTATRKLKEICSRLQELTEAEIELLVSGTRVEQLALLWLACCKYYQILAQFAREVLRDKFLKFDLQVTSAEVERFIESKAIWHKEIETLKPSTRTKLVTVIQRMLRESELIDDQGLLQPLLMSRQLARTIASHSYHYFDVFPVHEADVQGAIQ